MSAANELSLSALKCAIEGCDARTLAAFYREDAVMRIIDRDHPPSRPRDINGRAAIAGFFDDVCSRAMTHTLEHGVADRDVIAFTQSCAYPDGARVFCSAMLELRDGRIARQTVVQAWDG